MDMFMSFGFINKHSLRADVTCRASSLMRDGVVFPRLYALLAIQIAYGVVALRLCGVNHFQQ